LTGWHPAKQGSQAAIIKALRSQPDLQTPQHIIEHSGEQHEKRLWTVFFSSGNFWNYDGLRQSKN
jgi:hypothetical protein